LYLPLLALAAAAPMSALAETGSFGGKTLEIIVGMPPGGGVDSYARLVQRHLGRFLSGSPGIVVQNMPGAGSLRSVMALVNSPEDVVGTFSSSLLTEAVSMPERVKIDFRNFASIGNVSEDIRVCYTRSALGVRGWSDLLAREQVIFGATAPGTSGNVDTAMLRNLFGVRLKQVQGYAGSADKRLALERARSTAIAAAGPRSRRTGYGAERSTLFSGYPRCWWREWTAMCRLAAISWSTIAIARSTIS
jgi:tripartite-type tricarboxylate transporter receptor subunit TctC